MIAKNVIFEKMPDGSFLVISNGEYFRVHGVAADVFAMLIEGKSRAYILKKINSDYSADEKEILAHVERFYQDLTKLKILEAIII